MNEYAEQLADHIQNCLPPVDAVVVAQEGQITAPPEWVLVGTEVINGKRIRIFELPKDDDNGQV